MFSTVIQIALIVILIFLSAVFSSSETALTTISPHRLRTMVEENMKHALTLEKVLGKREKMLSVILICNNIVNIAASSLVTVFVQNTFGNWAISIGTGVLTVVILIFGEITPKTLATYNAEKLALLLAPVINALMIVFTPIAAAINFLSSGVLKLFSIDKNAKAESYTENEIRSIVAVSSEEGVIEDKEKEIINNIFDFNDTVARGVMVPRVNITAVNRTADFETIKSIFTDNMYTRFPVYDDENNHFIGMLNLKDVIFLSREDEGSFSLEKYMRPLPYTFEQKHLSELFVEMKKEHVSMMAVMDEYGQTVGIVTMEDLLEEIVGEIRDEYDDEDDVVMNTSENVYKVHGSVSIADINRELGTELSSENYDSVGGLIMEKLDRLPEEGETVQVDDCMITAERVDGAKIEEVSIRILNKNE
ncbi:MAG: HlyC/CorC family transporter [Bacteroidaceae bacterium]|nr:HlyC/CorC family transporter [Bacteroidaceae bacterium]MCF0228360.1 HlyC/CorC family transporter [Parasporobacterium sp.]